MIAAERARRRGLTGLVAPAPLPGPDSESTMSTTPEEWDATIEAFFCKPLPYRLRLAVSEFKVWENNVRSALVRCKFERCAYLGAREDAIRTGLVIGEEEQWVGDRDGPLQPFRFQEPDGTVEVLKMPLLASGRALQEAESCFARVRSQITTTVREVWCRYPDLIESNSPLACVCANECQWKKDVPEWAKTPIQVPKEWDGEYAGCSRLESGDRAVQTYWPAVEAQLIKLAAEIESRERDSNSGSAVAQVGGRLSVKELAQRYNLDDAQAEALRGRLRRWRPTHLNSEWIEVPRSYRLSKAPKYLYSPDKVLPIIEDLKMRSAKTSGERPSARK